MPLAMIDDANAGTARVEFDGILNSPDPVSALEGPK